MGHIYVERRQEFAARQFLVKDFEEIGQWLRDGYGVDAYLVTPCPDPRAVPIPHRGPHSHLLVILDMERPTGDRISEQVSIRDGDWLVYNYATCRWRILQDSEFQQNYEEVPTT